LPAPDPTVVVDPHFLMMLESSETFCMLSVLIILAIIYLLKFVSYYYYT